MKKPRSNSSHIDPFGKFAISADIVNVAGSAYYDYPYREQNVTLHNTTQRHFLRVSSIGVNNGKLVVDSLLVSLSSRTIPRQS